MDIDAIYQQLIGMVVPLKHDPTLGTDYLREKLIAVRTFSDTASDLHVQVNRALSSARGEVVAQRSVVKLADAATEKSERRLLDEMLESVDRLKYLREAVKIRRQNLIRTSADIRSLLDCIKTDLQGAGPTNPPPRDTWVEVGSVGVRVPETAAVDPDVSAFYAGKTVRDLVSDLDASDLDALFVDPEEEPIL